MENSSVFNNLNNFKNYVQNNKHDINKLDSNGDSLLHRLIKMSQEELNNSNFVNTSKYQQMADYLVKNGANINMLNKNNESVAINPNYNNNSKLEMSYNFESDTDFFSDTMVQSAVNQSGGNNYSDTSDNILSNNNTLSETSQSIFNQDGGKSRKQSSKRSQRSKRSNKSRNNQSISDTDITNIVFENISDNNSEPLQDHSFTLEDEEELVFDTNNLSSSSDNLDLYELDGGSDLSSSINQIYQGGGARRRSRGSSKRRSRGSSRRRSRGSSSRGSSRRRSRGSSRRRSRGSSRRRSRGSSRRRRRRSNDDEDVPKRKSKRRGSKKRKSKKMKRGLNPFMVVLAYYRAKNKGNSSLKVTDFGKNAGKIYRDAKAKAGANASSDEVIKAAKAMIDSKS